MKYYYGNSWKEAVSNDPIEIDSTEVLQQYMGNYNVVMPVEDEADLNLEEDSYELLEDGSLKISKDIFDDFNPDVLTLIKFLDEEDEPIREYRMLEEDDEWIYCEYVG